MIEPKRPRKPTLDYTVSALPDEILAIVRVTWYKDGKADEVDQVVMMEDGQNGYDAFAALVAFAVIAWFFSAAVFAAATAFVLLILYHREYRSDVLEVLAWILNM